jgi:hypothetical protein
VSPANAKKKSSDNYQDNSPSMISLITRDHKKVINDRIATFHHLMRSACYLKSYLRDLTLKRQEVLTLIDNFYFDDKRLAEVIYEHRIEHNNSKTLHKIRAYLDASSKTFFRPSRKVSHTFAETTEFMQYFEMLSNESGSALRAAYDKLDHRVYELWDYFGKTKQLIDFGKKLAKLATVIIEEHKADKKRV